MRAKGVRDDSLRPDIDTPSTPVAIVGAGPVGLALALGLARLGVRSVVVERKPSTSEHSRAPVIHVRTREIFRLWGIEDRFLDAGTLRRRIALLAANDDRRALIALDFAELEQEASEPGMLLLEQAHTERLLLEAVRESGLSELRFSTEATGLEHDRRGATLTLFGPGGHSTLAARFVVGCDGATSFVRQTLGLPFEGITYSVRPMLADIRIEDERDRLPWPRAHNGRGGLTVGIRLRAGLWRLIRLERGEPATGEEVTRSEVAERMAEVLGTGNFEMVWASRFRIHKRASPRFRIGNILLAGDAAHIHSPAGGLGMNGGIQDAHNLAWKLAFALRGGDVERLLDSYEVERRAAIVEDVSRYADLITRSFLDSPAPLRRAAFAIGSALLRNPLFRRRALRRTAMLNVGYDDSPLLDPRRPAAGARLPNPLLTSPEGTRVRLYEILPNGPAVLRLGPDDGSGNVDVGATIIRIGPGAYDDPAESLRRGLGTDGGWVLVRPDAHVIGIARSPEEVRAALEAGLGAAGARMG